jgi:hypothetical protein
MHSMSIHETGMHAIGAHDLDIFGAMHSMTMCSAWANMTWRTGISMQKTSVFFSNKKNLYPLDENTNFFQLYVAESFYADEKMARY